MEERRKDRKLLIWRILFIRGTVILLVLSLFAGIGYAFFGLPRTDNLESLQMIAATQVYDINGQLISKLFEQNRIVVTISNIAPSLQQAIIANEDIRFYWHIGVDPIGLLRAVWVNIQTGSLAEGASTLTQQLAREMFLTQERTFIRKIKEAILALIIESKFSKQEILQAYLNQVYFGEGAYGVEAASQVYLGKHASELTLAESALIAGLPRGPHIYSPYADLNAALKRRAMVLSGMMKAGYITEAQATQANAEPIALAGKKKRPVQASYFIDYVANELVGRYGANRVYKGGLKVYTSLDIKTQQAAEGVLGQYQGAVLAMDPQNGYIKAMVGGRDYQESQINRVTAEIRQPGSAFKPFLYAVALNQGMLPSAIVVDEPINIGGYSPQNYDKKYRGPITLRKALRWSVNIAAVKLGQQVGMDKVLEFAKSAGITSLVPQDNNLASALGGLTQGVNLMELTTGYTPFANGGVLSKPVAVLRVIDENGQVLEEARLIQQTIIRPEIAYIMTDMMKGVLENGTGTPANIGRPAAGKTGTTDNYETAWFIGYTPDLLVGIYMGNDNRKPIGISGTEVSALWGKMLVQVLAGTKSANFTVPANVVTGIPVCSDSGKISAPGCPEIEYMAFVRGTEPIMMDSRTRPGQAAPFPGTSEENQQREENKERRKWKLPWLRLPGF